MMKFATMSNHPTTDIIRFILDDKEVSINFTRTTRWTPTTTVLQYLRSLENHKGTKEGCAEGDCGACTVVVAQLENGKLSYTALNSCLIFLPFLHGKQLITVENLGSFDNMHPVQKILAEAGGSQCGFCTPGIVISAFALFKQHGKITRPEVVDALAGNLCRCTGYRLVIESVMHACENRKPDIFSGKEKKVVALLAAIRKDRSTIHLKTTDYSYYLPQSWQEALLLRQQLPEALVINGSTDVALRVTKKKEHLPLIIDISLVEELRLFRQTKKEMLIGAGCNLEEIRIAVREAFPMFSELLDVFGSRQIRHRATLGGNIASASPIGDTLPLLMAAGASVVIHSLKRKREILLSSFVTGYRQTALKPNELIYVIRIPIPSSAEILKFFKISKRKDVDISSVSGAFRLKLSRDKKISQVSLFFGGMAATTRPARQTEQFLKGKTWSRETIEQATVYLQKDFTPISDARAQAGGRVRMAANLLIKCWSETHTGKP
ncbi:MAG: xanthine dehydrogenase small subunit [Bacteroidetes bacterium]|nr:xanthine dehydrogenase small subunit [Bacteroidota bacterium]